MNAHRRPAAFVPSISANKAINLALQGGGTPGAFTWGVIDRLLEEKRLAIDGISATSAGSINAVVLAYGLATGGREGAKRTLAHFWRRISTAALSGMFQQSIFDKLTGSFGLDYSAGYILTNVLCQFLSPYQLNPFNLNPLRTVLEEIVDFEHIRQQTALKLFLCATNVRTGKLKIFRGRDLNVDHVLASSCMPFLVHAVEIDSDRYWDGGFVGNPALFPLIYECEARDIMLVHLTPTERPDFPVTASAILSRMQEISLNSSLMRELRAVAFFNRLIDQGRMSDGKKILVHVIEAQSELSALSNTSKMNCDWDFLVRLHAIGRKRADGWLVANFDCLGVNSTIDVETDFLADFPVVLGETP